MSFIGIDLGATFLKGAWLHPEQNQLSGVRREPFPGFISGLPAGHREIASDAVLAAVSRLIDHLLAEDPAACSGLLICGQMHGFVLVDQNTGSAGNFISWQDARCLEAGPSGASHFETAKLRLGPELRSALGNEFRPGLPAATLYAMSCRGELPANAMPISFMDFIAARLTGAKPVTHPSNAAAHGLFEVVGGHWHRAALDALGLGMIPLPPVQDATTPVGLCSLDGRSFPIFTPIGDQQAAILGTQLAPGELSLNIATGSQVSTLSRHPTINDWQLRPYFDGQWLRTVTHLPAGRALNRLVDLFGELAADQGTPLRDPWSQISRLAETADSQSLTANISFFPTAYGDEGSFTRIREDDIHVAAFFRASFKNMADNYARAAKQVAPDGWSRILFSGGLGQKIPALRTEILSRLGTAHRFASHHEDTLMGLLALARTIPSKHDHEAI
jgi:xylulokinase